MAFQKVEFEFPDEQEEETTEIEVEPSSEMEVNLPGKEKAVEATQDPEPEIEVIDDTPERDRDRVPSEPPEDVTEEELATYNKGVQNRIKHFSKGYHDERRAKETAERERDELERVVQQVLSENNNLKETVNKSRTTLLAQAKANVENELAQARNSYKVAHEEGDTENLLKSQETITTANLRRENLLKLEQDALQDSGNEVEIPDAQQQTDTRPPPDEKAVAWKERNTWFGAADNAPATAFALGLHKQLTEIENISASSDTYYEELDSRMQERFPELFEGTNEQEVRRPKARTSNVVAPATRSTAPKKIRLTQTQVALAKRLGITPAQYAKQVALDIRNSNG
jgi:hypothetical protein